MRLFPSDWDNPRPSNTDKAPVPADNNPGNDTNTGGYHPDEVAGTVFPYRGQEMHGVLPDTDPWQRGRDEHEHANPAVYDERDDPDPVPVRIVQEYKRERRSYSTTGSVAGANPQEMVGRNPRRTRLILRNLSAEVVIYIGRANEVSFMSGFPIDPGASFEMWGTDEVHGRSGDGTQVLIAVYQEMTVEG